jgi:hypothetical protein
MMKKKPTRSELLTKYPPAVTDRILQIWDMWPHVIASSSQQRNKERGEGPEVSNVEGPLAFRLKSLGHDVRRQVRCAGGRIDIVDITASDIIECKADGDLQSIVDAAKQLKRYHPSYPQMRLCIAVPFIEPSATWMADSLRNAGFQFIETDQFS